MHSFSFYIMIPTITPPKINCYSGQFFITLITLVLTMCTHLLGIDMHSIPKLNRFVHHSND